MAIYVVTGKLGSGKTLCMVGRIQDYLNHNRRVATNIDINLYQLITPQSKRCVVYRIPDRPIIDDLEAIGLGYEGDYQGEERNGLIVLDECAQFLNTRNFQDKERKHLLQWFVHARKKRWDVAFIIQHLNALDKQFRDMFAEHIVYCNRMDRLRLPFYLRYPARLLGFSGHLPKVHRALVMYGSGQHAMKVDSWVYTGRSLYNAFATEQGFNAEHQGGIVQLLPPYYTHGRFNSDWYYSKQKIKDFIKTFRFKVHQFFLIGLMLGIAGSLIANNQTFVKPSAQEATAVTESSSKAAVEKAQDESVDHYRITGSIIGQNYSEVFFVKNGEVYRPGAEGIHYFIKSPCHVILLLKSGKTDVYCEAARTRSGRQSRNKPSVSPQLTTEKLVNVALNQG